MKGFYLMSYFVTEDNNLRGPWTGVNSDAEFKMRYTKCINFYYVVYRNVRLRNLERLR